ncbi:hypothetical protein Aglo03_09620 [Actinokineospora globicatena]|uniref:Uncharacterized protein n=1 Tax=Actinokineospora globicatena TaxID=103729 RepID=A0A9W6QHG9_9PSEU|nr:hypothetical protein Aglo03_09620 [Actinokineospora globicatena]
MADPFAACRARPAGHGRLAGVRQALAGSTGGTAVDDLVLLVGSYGVDGSVDGWSCLAARLSGPRSSLITPTCPAELTLSRFESRATASNRKGDTKVNFVTVT